MLVAKDGGFSIAFRICELLIDNHLSRGVHGVLMVGGCIRNLDDFIRDDEHLTDWKQNQQRHRTSENAPVRRDDGTQLIEIKQEIQHPVCLSVAGSAVSELCV